MDGDGTAASGSSLVPDGFVDFGCRKDLPRVLHQKQKNRILRRGQGDLLPVHGDALCIIIEGNPANGKNIILTLRTAA